MVQDTRQSIYFRNYFPNAFGDVDKLISDAETQLYGANVDFDTMVGVGVSGLLVLPILARHFKTHMLAVRKPGSESHSISNLEGTLGKRWILVDDFVSTGATIKLAKYLIKGAAVSYNFKTKYAGTYGYGTNKFNQANFYLPLPGDPRVSYAKVDTDGKSHYVLVS